MANFSSPDFSGLRQQFPGQMFGPRHSSPNIVGASSPVPPNVGPIPNVPPPGFVGPHMQLFNPMGVQPFPTGLPAMTALPWGAGVMPIRGQVPPMTIPPPLPGFPPVLAQPPLPIPVASHLPPQPQIDQSDTQKNLAEDEKKNERKHKHRHKHERHHRHHDDKQRERKHSVEKKRSPKNSHHHDRDGKKSTKSRHRSGKSHDSKSSKSSHSHRRRHSPHHAEPLEDFRGNRSSEREHHGAVLIEDRESDYERQGDKFEDYDVEDGEIYDDEPYETTYSENQYAEDDRRDWRKDKRYERDDRYPEDAGNGSRDRGREGRNERYREVRPEGGRNNRSSEREDRIYDRYKDDEIGRRDERSYPRDDRKFYDEFRQEDRLRQEEEIHHKRHSRYKEPGEIDAFRNDGSARHKGTSRKDKYLAHEDEFTDRYNERERQFDRRGSQSEKSVGRRGQTGAVLIEDRDERPLLIEDRRDRPILMDDRDHRPILREERRDRPVLIEDREERPVFREDRAYSGRSGAVLLENGEEFDENFGRRRKTDQQSRFKDDRRENRGHAILLDDREDNTRLKEDKRDYSDHFANSVDERGGSRGGGIKRSREWSSGVERRDEIDDVSSENFARNKDMLERRQIGRGHEHFGKNKNEKKKGNELTKGRASTCSNFEEPKFKGPDGRGRVAEVAFEAQRGHSGALLLEDREKQKRGDRLDTSTGRTGAVLIEDRADEKTFDKGQRGRGTLLKGQAQRSFPRKDSRTDLKGCSQERSSRPQGNKRSRSTSKVRQEVRIKRERGSNEREEPDKKKRRVWEPAPDDVSTTKCIRSGSPVVLNDSEIDSDPIAAWVRCSAGDLYFTKDAKTGNLMTTKRMRDLEERFDHELVQRAAMVRALQEPYERPVLKPNWKNQCKGHTHQCSHCGKGEDSDCSSSSSSSDSDSESDLEEWWMEEMKFKQQNPYRLHNEIWYNEPNELNYGPLCRCSNKARKFGIRHSIYPGEEPLPQCDLNSNNLDKLYHYRITVSPVKNFIISQPTVIMFDGHEYLFEGFSLFSHKPIPKLPECQVIRFNIIYTIHIMEEQVPENFSVQSLDMVTDYLFDEILELIDVDWRGPGGEGNCRRFHVMPRFARPFPENGKELLSMNDVLLYLLKSSKPLLEPSELLSMYELDNENWTKYVDSFRHMVVTCPGKRPSSIRIDQLDRSGCTPGEGELKLPFIIHHGVRPPQLSYAGDPIYKKKWREYMKFRHLLWSRAKVPDNERQKLIELEMELEKIRMKCTLKREVTVAVSSDGFLKTGIRADICQHAMLLPVLFEHLRFHECLSALEKSIGYQFKDRSLLQLALTHSSYKMNYGTNPDHGRNSLSNCGFRQLEFGDHKAVTQHMRKRGLNVLLRIMAKMGEREEKRSEIPHNERLEFLGDAVVEFVTSTHLFSMFPQAPEGELTLYRGSLVNNAHLSILADKLQLQDYLLYAHGPDLCHDSNLKHAMANCFEALMGALFLDGGIEEADRVFSNTCFHEDDLLDTWLNPPKHPLIADEPDGDRHWIEQSHVLQKLTQFEEDIGYEFRHIRLLARAFTQRNVGYNNLTYGHNQRLEFLGDTIMQLICTDYLFKHFPGHHEGHLTLLRSSLVNNKTQSTVSTELGMTDFVIKANMTKAERSLNYSDLKTKEKADLLEALYGALYVDGGLEPCQILTNVCFFPRLEDFILDQEWNDPKSQLQQCCLTLREMNDDSPDIPIYKVIRKYGPTNLRKYVVAVYFREKRLAVGVAGSIQQAEMVAAESALKQSQGLFNKNVYPSKIKKKAAVFLKKKEIKKEPKVSKLQ